MSLISTLENKFGHLAIPHVVKILAGFQVAVFIMLQLQPEFANFINLSRAQVLHGEVWRLITWVFFPSATNPLWLFFAVMLMFMMGDGLEKAWGAFRLNLYILGGIIAVDVGTVFFGFPPPPLTVYSSIFLAFAVFFPDFEILIFFILPVKVKYLAWLTLAAQFFMVMQTPALWPSVLFGLANYIVAFGPGLLKATKQKAVVMERRARYDSAQLPAGSFFHKCHACSKTELDNPALEFRVATDGEDYCSVCRPKK